MIQSQGHLPSCSRTNGMVGERNHASRWFPRGQRLEKKSAIRRSDPVMAGRSSPLSWPGRVPGHSAAFQRLGSSLLSLLCKDTEQSSSTSSSCLPKFPNAWPHSFTHSFTPLLHTHLSRPRSSVAGTGDIEMNNTRNAVVKELALWEGREPNASLEESSRVPSRLGNGQVEGRWAWRAVEGWEEACLWGGMEVQGILRIISSLHGWSRDQGEERLGLVTQLTMLAA